MNKNLKDVIFFSLIFLAIDQGIKLYINGSMVLNQSIILIKNFLSITYVENSGAAFSILSGNRWLLVLIGVAAVVALIIYVSKLAYVNDFDIFSYALLLGGISGNLVDRIFRGVVIDYLDFNIFGYHFPIFNFADICIVGSIVLIFCSAIKGDLWREK